MQRSLLSFYTEITPAKSKPTKISISTIFLVVVPFKLDQITHLSDTAKRTGGTEGIDAGSGNGDSGKGKRGEFHGCV